MKSRRKANSQPQLSKFKQGFYHHTDEVERAEDDSGVAYRMEKYSDDLTKYNVECDFVTFHPDALQKKNYFEKRERKKEVFYSKGNDLYGYSVFEEGETPTGCGMYSLDYYDSFAQKDLDDMSDDDYIEYNDCYLYLSNLSKLYYIKDRKLEEVNLNDEREFLRELTKFMNTEDDKFTLRRMSYTDIFRVITRTSGHMPVHMVSATPPSPCEKYQTYKGLYEFYLQQKATESLPSPPYRHSHIVDKGDWHDVLIVEKCDEDPCDRPRYRPF